MRHTLDQSNDTTSKLSNRTSPTKCTAEFSNSVDNNFVMMIPMPPPALRISSTALSDSHNSDSDMTNQTTCHNANTDNWLSNSFTLVFKALDCLAIEIANLSDRILAATSKSIVDPPLPLTANPQPHHPQSIYPRLYQLLHMVTQSCHAPNPITKHRPHTHQQNPYPKQTHQHDSHCNHTKYR